MTTESGDKPAPRRWWKALVGRNSSTSVMSVDATVPDTPEYVANGDEQVDTSMAAVAVPKSLSSPLLASYVVSGGYDELLDAKGGVAPHWQPVVAGLEALTHQQRLDRIDRINFRVRETGIAHDVFADPARNLQPWRLDLVPLVLSTETWSHLETAVTQRGRLLEAMLTDIYGPQETLRRGLIPPELIFSDPGYLRASQNIAPVAGRIQFFAADLARSADGSWRVVDTHLETPAGIGYALANRTVLSHVSGDMFNACRAIRLAPFFQRMQDSLTRRANRPDPNIALLTPGPYHSDFFSHTYLARYLGLQLVEGADLRAEDGSVFLKTLDGLHPIDLIVRCVAGASSDALELDPAGFLGPVGLVQAVRQRPDLVVNALGAAIAENRGLGSYLPQLCQDLLGEELAIWDITKWWLGDKAVRRTVIAELDRYFIRHAFEQTARPGKAEPARDPATMSAADRAALVSEIELAGASLVAEEKTTLGTAPTYGPNGLESKPFTLRVFATAVPGGFAVMPGGLAMTVAPGQSMAMTAPDGASRDIWVVSDKPQPVFKSLWRPTAMAAQIQRSPRELPSRAADNLFWLGRYVENADWTFRVLRNCLSRVEEDSGARQYLPVARAALTNLLERDRAPAAQINPDGDHATAIRHLTGTLMTSVEITHGLPQTLGHVHRIASLTRDRLSLEAWRTLNAFYVARHWQSGAVPDSVGQSLDLIDSGLTAISAFNGLSHENMTRNFGWSFLDMGRRMSRVHNLSQLLLATLTTVSSEDDDSNSMLFALEVADSFMTYRSRYRLNVMIAPALDLLIVDETNPRSLGFQLAALTAHIDTLPHPDAGRGRTEAQRIALALLNDVQLADVVRLSEVDPNGRRIDLAGLLNTASARIPRLSEAITRRYFSVVGVEPTWARARSRVDQ